MVASPTRRALVATLLFACTTISSAVSCYDGNASFLRSDWPHCFQPAPDILVYAGESSDGNYMKLGMHASGHAGAWSALAFAGNGGMKGARQIVVRQVKDQWVAEDRYSTEYVTPSLDDSQDVALMFASEENGSTSWGVLLPLDACKPEKDGYPRNYPLSYDIARWMHWALGTSHAFQYHGSRKGPFHANLISGPAVLPATSGLETVDLKMPGVDVVLGPGGTDASNPYLCSIFDLAQLVPGKNISEKHHVAKFAPYLHDASAKYVHHMILYGCDEGMATALNLTHGQIIPQCESMPKGCYEMKWPWAKGSQDVVFPSDVGMPFGEGHRWLALQMHYYNPDLDKNVKDSSGVSLVFASSVRSEDAGVLTFNGGTNPDMRDALPSGQSQVTINFTVPPACTRKWTAPYINILGLLHHTHTLGKYLKIDVLRSGIYQGMLRHENQYDFNHQSLEESAIRKLYPGDELTLSCTYDTSSKTDPVSFGDLTQTEMCWSAAFYYPRQKVTDPAYSKVERSKLEARTTSAKMVCLAPGTGDYSDVSACAQLMALDPLMFKDSPNTGISGMSLCNSGIPVYGTAADLMAEWWPGMCPSCFLSSSCTEAAMKQHGQEAVCPQMCNASALSVYPDMARTEAITPTHRTHCDGDVDFVPSPIVFPACTKRGGDLTSSAALSAINVLSRSAMVSTSSPPGKSNGGSAAVSGSRAMLPVSCLICAAIILLCQTAPSA
mmetsp:Transcript_29493/g.52757  ORF Transcript_29493/g.52757 Transcript_29493/m.52757 type:complete len:724 (-) Transcript_29493:399-2570(-)